MTGEVARTKEHENKSPEFFIVLTVKPTHDGVTGNCEAVALRAEWEAHAVATMALNLGARAFFIDTSGDDDHPTIEEYHHDA